MAKRLATPCVPVLGLLFVLSPVTPAQGQPRILSKDGSRLVLSVGSDAGVQEGMTGKVIGAELLLGTVQRREIGSFRVTAAAPDTCEATLTSVRAGWLVKVDLEVVFDTPLPGLRGTAPESPAARSEAERIRSIANAAWERRDWRAAIRAYKELIQLNPGDQEAHARLRQAQDRQELASQQVRPSMPAEGLTRSQREAQEARRRDRELIPVYRETARRALDAGNWDEAVQPLRNLALADPQDTFLQSAITRRREEAERAFAANDYDATIAACETVLGIVEDPVAARLRQRAILARVETKVSPTVHQAEEMIKEMETLEDATRSGRVPGDMVSLLQRRVATLAQLTEAQSDATGTATRDYVVDLTNRLAAAGMVHVPGATYTMGCVEGDRECDADEKPPRPVIVDPFMIEPTEVTVAQFVAFAVSTAHPKPAAPGFTQDHLHPMVNVSWFDAASYCAWIGGRLPTEAEWELAARGGVEGQKYPWGARLDHSRTNFEGSSGEDRWDRTAPVGSFPPNRLGLLDPVGNVWEWCQDWYRTDYISPASRDPDSGPAPTGLRSLRGGSWLAGPRHLRTSTRSWFPPSGRAFNIGFRCARSD